MSRDRRGLWQHRDFMKLWTGQTISKFGSQIGGGALRLTAILVLGATPLQLGLLTAASVFPTLLLGLLAGVWVDRLRRRPLLIVADLLRAVLLVSIPIAFLLGALTMAQLYLVALLVGTLTLIFDSESAASARWLARSSHNRWLRAWASGEHWSDRWWPDVGRACCYRWQADRAPPRC